MFGSFCVCKYCPPDSYLQRVCVFIGDRCIVRYTHLIIIYIYIFYHLCHNYTSYTLISVFIHTFSTQPHCQRLQLKHLAPQIVSLLSTTIQHCSPKGSKGTQENKKGFWRLPNMEIHTQSWRCGLGGAYSPVSALGRRMAFLFVFIFSTSKLYKYMQHTSWPKVCGTNTHLVSFF